MGKRVFIVAIDAVLFCFLFVLYLFYALILRVIFKFSDRKGKKKVLMRITVGASFEDSVKKYGEEGAKNLIETEVPSSLADEAIIILFQGRRGRFLKLSDYLTVIETAQPFKGKILQLDLTYLALQMFYLGTIAWRKEIGLVWTLDPYGTFVVGYWVSKVTGAKLVLSQATDYTLTNIVPKYAKISFIRKAVEKFSYSRCDVFLALCTSYVHSIRKQHGSVIDKKYRVVHVPYDFKRVDKSIDLGIQKTLRRKFNLENKKLVTTVSRLSPEKYIEDVIEVAKLVSDSNILFVIIGDGPLREKLRLLIHKWNLDNVIITGFLSRKEVYNFLKLSSVYFSPLTGLALIEAMYLENYVIAYNIDVHIDYVTNYTGRLVDFRDYVGVAESIKSFFANPEKYKENIKKAKELVVKRNNVEVVAQKLHSIFWESKRCNYSAIYVSKT